MFNKSLESTRLSCIILVVVISLLGSNFSFGQCDNGITGGSFADLSAWSAPAGHTIRIVDQAGSRGAVIRDRGSDKFALQQVIYSVKPSFQYELTFGYENFINGCPSAMSKFKVEVLADGVPLLVTPSQFEATNNASGGAPPSAFIQFTTPSVVKSLLIRITDDGSPTPACGAFISNLVLRSPMEVTTVATPAGCYGDTQGSFSVQATGGAAPYSASYSASGGSQVSFPILGGKGEVTNLAAGNYTIAITDANNCTVTRVVNVPGATTALSVKATPVMCYGGTTGSVSVTATGGTPGYTYSLNGSINNTGYFTNLTAGTYSVSVWDQNGCPSLTTFTIGQPISPLTASAGSIATSCFGATDGTLRVSASGGVAPYRYIVNGNSNTTGTFLNLSAGDYFIRIVDANNCETYSYATIEQPEAIVPAFTVKDVHCFGESNGTVSLFASGGSGQYEFTLNGSTNATGFFGNLAAGSYTARVQDRLLNCSEDVIIAVGQPASKLSAIATPTKCFGELTGSITAVASGGTPGYTYTLGGESNNTGYFDNLAAGTYTIFVQDGKGCRTSAIATILEANAPLTLAASVFNNNCRGGTNGAITAVASGGAGGYRYTINGTTNTSGEFRGLAAGSYTVTVTDANGCRTHTQATIDEPASGLNARASANPASCFGAADGSLQVTASGGTNGYSYTLNNITNSTGSFTGLAGGTYDIRVTDGIGCSVTISAIVEQPAALTASAQATWCLGQTAASVAVTASGGNPGYQFIWNGVTNTSGIFTGLSSGTHVIRVRDAGNCTTTVQVSLDTPSQELSLSVAQKKDVLCFGESSGRIALSALGGVPPYHFIVNDSTSNSGIFENLAAGTYTASVTDANGCRATIPVTVRETSTAIKTAISTTAVTCFGEANGSLQVSAAGGAGGYQYTLQGTTNSTGTFTSLPAGTYTILVTDRNNCAVSVVATISEPSGELTVTTRAEKCGTANGSIYLAASGGRPTYTYHLNGMSNTTGIFTDLNNGTYLFLVTDASNCSQAVVVTLAEPISPLSVDIVRSTDVACFGSSSGSVQVKAKGGVAPYTYSVNGNSNTTGWFSGLEAGTYSIIITDRNGCTVQQSIVIQELSSAPLRAEVNVVPVTCAGESNGSIHLVTTGGAAPYRFTLNGISNETGRFENLPSGTYSIVITDSKGCSEPVSASIDPVNPVEASVSSSDASCFGETDGSLTVQATGGTGNYQYTVNEIRNTTGRFVGLAAGSYVIHVRDGNGCSTIVQATIRQPAALKASATTRPATAANAGDGSALVTVHGGTPAYTFRLAGVSSSTGAFSGLAPGNYLVEVSDSRGCSVQVPLVIQALNLVSLTPAVTVTTEGKKVSVTAQLREPFAEDVLITLGYSGSASGKQDYLLTDQYQTIRIPQGAVSTSEKVTIHALSDAIEESDEDLQLVILTTSHPLVHIGAGAAVIIQDVNPDDPMVDHSVPENKDLFPDPLVSPNDDGEGNEFFNIGNILSFPENEVIIYNRWGNIVFKVAGYNATDKVFRGFANTGLSLSAPEPLVDGVYYYVIYTYKVVNSVRERRLNKGYLILKR